ncbi:unnamed protein product [Caenorhabditis auriculariae]|uniref:Signal transducing adapter molecule 1 n=1 Tax=Caenorhabditis auriculariae TaxID=2777116 RepID=A0A8S1GML4_9PELO|nr:unnamed protein product [Caenorhabditis auriculariae]
MSVNYDDIVEKITASTLTTENWDGILGLCDKVNADSDNGKAALKSLRKRLNNRDPHVILMALSVLDSCWSNCGAKFRREVSSASFINELKAQCTSSHRVVGEKARQIVEKWTEAECKADQSLSLIVSLYRSLKEDGLSFSADEPKKQTANAMAKYSNDPNFVSTQQEEDEIAKAIAASLADAEKQEKSRKSTGIYPTSTVKTPILTSTPKSERKVRALYDFEAAEGNELSFVAGDVICITDDSNPHWWTGRIGVQQGLFPSSFVTSSLDDEPEFSQNASSQQQQSIVPTINEAILVRCLNVLHECDPTGVRPDPADLSQLEAASYAQAPLIDARLAGIDRQSNALAQVDIAIRDVLALYDDVIQRSGYQQPQMYQHHSVGPQQPYPPQQSTQPQYNYPLQYAPGQTQQTAPYAQQYSAAASVAPAVAPQSFNAPTSAAYGPPQAWNQQPPVNQPY